MAKQRVTAKDKARVKLLDFLGNPDMPWPSRGDLSTYVLGYKNPHHIHNIFTAVELHEIDTEALVLRRQKYAPKIAEVDKGMLGKAPHDTQAARLIYQRFEDWAPRKRHEVSGPTGEPIEISLIWPEAANNKGD
jgi:hypothetical protein